VEVRAARRCFAVRSAKRLRQQDDVSAPLAKSQSHVEQEK
jgi:hypothetical protein